MQNEKTITDVLAIPIAFLFLAGLIWFVYDQNRYHINTALIYSAQGLLYPLYFLPQTPEAINQLKNLRAENLTFFNIFEILNFAGRFYAMFAIPLAIFWIYRIKMTEVHETYIRYFSMDQLVKNNAEFLPFLKPVANRPRSILDEPQTHGAWASPVMPINWVVKHGLLKDRKDNVIDYHTVINPEDDTPFNNPLYCPLLTQSKREREELGIYLDKEMCYEIWTKQLSRKLETNHAKLAYTLKDYEAGLVAALICYGKGDKERGFDYISLMGESFKEGKWDEKTKTASGYELDIGDAREYITETLTNNMDEGLAVSFRLHGTYIYPWIMSLAKHYAGNKSVFMSSLYMFLRPTDNLLFLTVNQVGSDTGWVESLMTWTHFEVEEVAGYTINEIDYSLELAYKYLVDDLEDSGLIGNDPNYYK